MSSQVLCPLKRYANEAAARAAVRGLARRARATPLGFPTQALTTYLCPECRGWHVGRLRANRQR